MTLRTTRADGQPVLAARRDRQRQDGIGERNGPGVPAARSQSSSRPPRPSGPQPPAASVLPSAVNVTA